MSITVQAATDIAAALSHQTAPHPSWCIDRHVDGSSVAQDHRGEFILLAFPDTFDVPLDARLASDEFQRTTHLYVEDGQGGAQLNARQGREFVANLREFANRIEAELVHLPEVQ